MLEVELYKIVDAGHFWCKPSSRNRSEAEKYYTLSGRINDYCCKTQTQSSNQKSKIPKKGKICLVKRTSDKCWYRAKVLSIFQTMTGPQARVLLVDLGERTLVPGIWVQEIPEEFMNIPYQTMECVLSGLKPLSMVTSYFDLTTKKQPGDTWDISATEWFKRQITGCSVQLDVKHIDEDGIHHVFLFATGSDDAMICLNDELVNNEYAVVSKSTFEATQNQKEISPSPSQDSFSEELKNIREKFSNSLSMNGNATTSAKSDRYQPLTNGAKPLTWSEESDGSGQGSGTELGKQPISTQVFSSDEERGRVRFMSARLPATGTGASRSYKPLESVKKQPKPILKHSSGYSSSEDSQRDTYSQGKLSNNFGGNSKGNNPAFAHDQNANLTKKNNGVKQSLNSNVYNSPPRDSQRSIYSNQELPRIVGKPPGNSSSAHDQNADEMRQSQTVAPSNKFSSGHQYGQNMPNTGSTFTPQNIRNGFQTFGQDSSCDHPTFSTNQERRPVQGNHQSVSSSQASDEGMYNTSSNRDFSSSFSQQNIQNSSRGFFPHQPVTSHQNNPPNAPGNPPSFPSSNHPQSTRIPTSQVQSPYTPASAGSHFPNGQNNTVQSTDIHRNQQLQQNLPTQTSHYAPKSTSQSHQHPTSQTQHTDISYNQRQQKYFHSTSQNENIPTNTVPFSSIPNSQAQSTSVPQSQVHQQYFQTKQSQYTPNSTPKYPHVPANPVQSTSVPQSQVQQQYCQTKQSQYTPSTPKYPHVSTNPTQSTSVPQSQPQRQNFSTEYMQYSQTRPSENLNVPTSQEQPKDISPLRQQNIPPRQPQYVPTSTSGFPHVPSNQAQSTCVPLNQGQQQNHPPRQSKYVPLVTSEYPYVPSNQKQFTGLLSSKTQQQNVQFSLNQSQYISASTSKYPNVPTSQSSQTFYDSTYSQQSTGVPTSMAQSQDILSHTPLQRLPTGVTPSSRIPNNQVQSHYTSTTTSTQHPATSYPTHIPQSTSQSTSIQAIPSTYQQIRNNQDESPSSSTQHPSNAPSFSHASPIPKSPVQPSSIQSSPTKSPRIPPSSPMPNAKLCNVTKGVFEHGEGLLKSFTEMDSTTFPDQVLRGLRDLGVTKPNSFQASIWAMIMRGRDVFGIPETTSDNVMAYLAPVITLLTEPAAYSELPLGNGPFALILCEGWRKGAIVYEQCRKLTKNVRNIRVQIVYGAGAEDECIPQLINGCEVLIATPACLLRMLRKKITRLDRLCHLVFDDADILAEEQTESVKELMREYTALLKSQPNRQAPRQCIAIGNKWTTGICSLVRVYLENPLIVIGNLIEAAMFCKVRQIVNYVSSSKRESELLRLLDKYTLNNEHEIIIFTSTAKDAERLAQLLQHYSFTILLAHEFLWPEQLNEVRRQWNTPHSSDSFLILVMTDGVIDKCNIRTASCVIHYDSPPSKKMFGRRMFCMAASYPSTKEKECLSLTIGTEHSTGCARNIKELALRSSGVVPPTLEKVCEYSYQEKEEKKKNDDLCCLLKAFGHCKDLLQCKSRHTVFPDVDVSVLLPKSGIVKVLILAVLDASRYFVRILEHQSETKETNSTNYYSGATFLKLALDLNSVYTSRDNRHVCSRIHLQKLCVVESEGSYYRAKIIQVSRADPETNRALEVQVYFTDRGFYEIVPTRNLFEIAPQFVDIPYQAVEAYMCRIKPLDNDKHWTNKAVRFVVQHIEGQELEGKVIMGLRNTIWLDPLVAKAHLQEINVTTNTFNVRLDLLKEGLAVPNQEHVENLKKHFASFLRLKDVTGRENFERSSDSQQIETCTLPERHDEMVRVSSILNPELLFVRLDAQCNSLEDLLDKINENIETQPAESHEDLGIGSLCLAKFTEDERWYRAKILSIRPEKEFDVFFVDYGDREWVSEDRIAAIRPEYLQFPFQAIECSLVNISPFETEWTADDTEALWKLTEDKLLWAKVKSKSAAMLSGTCRYDIVLTDTSTERDVIVNHELVVAGHAQATLEYYKVLFPEAFDSSNTGHLKEQFEEIPGLCLQLYRSQDPNIKLRFAQEIKNIVSQNMKKKDEIRESGGVRCICRLLGVSKNEAVQEYIIITLAFLATQNDLNCEEIRREGGLKILCDLLNKAKNVKVQEHVAWTLKHLATNERNRDDTREIGGIKNLCDLLSTTVHEKVQENICWAIVSLCSDNNKNCDAIREEGGVATLFILLETTRNNFVLENTMWAISLLAYNAGNKKLIGEQGGIEKICNLIRTNQDEKILQNAIRTLKTLSSYNDENRDIMCRLGIIDLMRRLSKVETRLPFDTRRTCLDLIQRLLGRAPDVPLLEASSITSPLQEPIRCKPISVTKKRKSTQENDKMVNGRENSDDDLPLLEDTNDMVCPGVHPMTMWSQTKRFVTLSIKLRGVQDKTTNIAEKNFYFRTRHLEKLYELNLELFAGVIPKESKVHLRGSEVLVNLKKVQPATWQRLLSTKDKPPFLSVDFDRWNTDSGSDEENEITQPRVPTKREKHVPPLPFDDDKSESSEGFSDEDLDTRDRLGLDFAY